MITAIDHQLIVWVERRIKMAERIGREKAALGLPIEDRAVERTVRERMQRLNAASQGCGDDFADLLVSHAKQVQHQQQAQWSDVR